LDGFVVHGSAAWPTDRPGPVVTVGNFDGVHLGHRALLDRVVARAHEMGRPAVAYTFDPLPVEVLRPDLRQPRIQSTADRLAALRNTGLDHVVVEPFDLAFSEHEARWFAHEILGARLRASAIVVGWDFRFGHGRAGTLGDLARWLAVPVESFGPWSREGEVVSSRGIRARVLAGDVEGAALWLGRPHRVSGVVVRGAARGRTIGFPTANVSPATELLPADGVYAVRATLDRGWNGVANLGVRPTVDGTHRVLEVHLFDFSGDAYGHAISVDFVARLREERRFPSLEALTAQIRADAEAARALLERG
jgi:riboflavin kinase/FMN adenylyltransferase